MKNGNEEAREIVSTGDFEESDFSVKLSGDAFKILSSALYSNKPLAIVRELSCNAKDAHVSAGTQAVPFVITLPNWESMQFSIRDFGTGLDDKGIREVFCSYFNSSKTDSNDQIGGFGLGSKTPFSYTEMFSIVSYLNKEKRTYVAMLGETGIPSCKLMDTCVTEEANGLDISFPVYEGDIYLFTQACAQALRPFPKECYIVKGDDINVTDFNHVVDGTGWFFDTARRHYIVRMGNVEYHLTYDNMVQVQALIGTKGQHKLLKQSGLRLTEWLNNHGVVVEVPIGACTPTPSRESLQMDKKTLKTLVDVSEAIIEEYVQNVEKELAAVTTLKEYRKLYTNLFMRTDGKYTELAGYFKAQFHGEPVALKLRHTVNPIGNLYIQKHYTQGRGASGPRVYQESNLETEFICDLEELDIWVDDTAVKSYHSANKKMENHLKTLRNATSTDIQCILLCRASTSVIEDTTNPKPPEPTLQELENFFAFFGKDYAKDAKLLTKIPKPAQDKKVSRDLTCYTHGVYKVISSGIDHSHGVDLTAGGFYVPVEKGVGAILGADGMRYAYYELYHAVNAYNAAVPNGIKILPIVGFSKLTEKKALKEGAWLNVIDTLRVEAHKLLADPAYAEYREHQENERAYNEQPLVKDLAAQGNLIYAEIDTTNSPLVAAVQAHQAFVRKGKAPTGMQRYSTLNYLFQCEYTVIPPKKLVLEDLTERYPLLGVTGTNYFRDGYYRKTKHETIAVDLANYIKQIDSQTKAQGTP